MVGKEDGMQVREMGESTPHLAEAHSGTVGRKREDEDRSTAGKGSSAGAVDRTIEWRGGQKAENGPGRTRGTNRMKVGNSWPPTFFSSNLKSLRAGGAGPRQASRVKAQSNLVDEIWASKHLSRAQSFSKPRPLSETDVGWKREVPGKGPIQSMGQELGGKQDRLSKGPSHRATHSAKGKAKVGYEESENQRRGSTVKCGSKKLWNVLLPSSSACRQGDRSRGEPFMTERSPTGSDTLPLEEAAEAGSQLFQGCSEEGTTPTEEIAEQRNILKAPFMSKEKEKMRNNAIRENGAGVKGFAGYSRSGSSVSDHPSYPANREKGLIFEGYCGMTKVGIFQVSSHYSSQPSLPFQSPFSSVAPPYQSPSNPDLSISAFHSHIPMKNRVLTENCSKKNVVEDYHLGYVGNPNHVEAVSQLTRLNLMSESFKYDKTNPSSPHGAPILGAVSQGDSEFSQMSGFQIEGLFPRKWLKFVRS